MKSFKGLLREELLLEKEKAKKASATVYEAYLTVAYNGGVGEKHTMSGKALSSAIRDTNLAFLDGIGKDEKSYLVQEPGALQIAKPLYNKFHGKMKHEGKLSGSLSAEWKSWGGTNTTSKTDNSIGDIRLSLKAGSSAQFMSSHVDESVAIFRSAVEAMKGKEPKGFDHLIKKVESTLSIQVEKGFKIGDFLKPIKALQKKLKAAGKGEVDDKGKVQSKKTGFWNKKNLKLKTKTQGSSPTVADQLPPEAVDQTFFNQSKFQDDVSEDLTVFFEHNDIFKEWFVFEAMSGLRKFSNIEPKANWVLNFDYSPDGKSGEILHLEQLEKGGKPTSWIQSKSKEANIRCNWKNHGMSTNAIYPSIRAEFDADKIRNRMKSSLRRGGELHKLYGEDYEPEYTLMSELITEELNSFVVSESLLIEEAIQDMQLINEGLLAWGKSKVKKLYDKLKSFLYKIIEKVKVTMKKLGKLGMDHVYQFLGVDIKSVAVRGF